MTGDAYGNTLSDRSGTDTFPYPFGGALSYWSEPELGLQYVRARWLDASTGRWLSTDPVDGEITYAYSKRR